MDDIIDHSHHHAEAGGATGNKLLLSILITSLTLVAEVVGGILTGSLALLSDAAHVFLDIFALALSYGAVRISTRAASSRHTFGFRRVKVLAAFANGVTLLIVAIEIFREAIARFAHPEPVIAGPMLIVAAIGLAANLIVALVLKGHDHDDLNARAAFLHVLGDALSSVGVIIAGFVMLLTGWTWVDPAASVLIGFVILTGAWRVLKEVIHILNEGSPESANPDEVSAALAMVPGVRAVHDLHIWTIEPGYPVMSAHVLLKDQLLSDTGAIMDSIKDIADHRFGIEHTTVQFECSDCGQHCVDCGVGCESGDGCNDGGNDDSPESRR
ncbi:MAG TPA: cation diffusion facilitator family transporter [Rectinemataceae bacterium]|nr:cation diffusion facilitator family transporter [Rectinemataceae bacterium]